MNGRERFLSCILGEPLDRPPYWLAWGPWGTTWERWVQEGKPERLSNFEAVQAMFDPDPNPRALPVNCGPCPSREQAVLEETEEYVIFTDSWGIKRKNLKGWESMSDFLEFPVKTREDWERYRDEWLDPDRPERLAGDWRRQCTDWQSKGYPIQLGYYPDVGVFGTYRWLLGDEAGLVAFYTMPDLVHEIMDHMTSVYLTVFAKVVREVRVDVIHLWEDMCYRNGPLISPAFWEEFLGPNYRRIKAFADEHGIPVISVDTDGDPDKIAPAMLDAGVNYLLPMEVGAGCDVNAWRAKYPRLGMSGGVDKRVLAKGQEAIDRELERVRPAMEKGRYIPTLDHCIPDDVSWENYLYYAEAAKRMVGKE